MKILIDMNLSPIWVDYFATYQIESIHWVNVGEPNAKDKEIFDYARDNGFVVFTNDLDFSTILASSRATFPSVIQVRTQNLLPNYIGQTVIELLSQFDQMISNGCLLTFDENKIRTRILPLF